MVSVRYLSDFNSKFFTKDFLYTFLVGGNSNILGIFTPKIGEDEPILTKGVGSTTNLLCPAPCCRFEAIAQTRVVEAVPWAIVFPHGISWFTRRRHHFPAGSWTCWKLEDEDAPWEWCYFRKVIFRIFHNFPRDMFFFQEWNSFGKWADEMRLWDDHVIGWHDAQVRSFSPKQSVHLEGNWWKGLVWGSI